MFKKIAEMAYLEFGTVVFALELELKTQPSRAIIRLNPSQYALEDWNFFYYYLYVICPEESDARRLQKIELSDEKYLKWIGKERTDKEKSKIPQKSVDLT